MQTHVKDLILACTVVPVICGDHRATRMHAKDHAVYVRLVSQLDLLSMHNLSGMLEELRLLYSVHSFRNNQ